MRRAMGPRMRQPFDNCDEFESEVHDTSSEEKGDPRHSVGGAYRDGREALVAQRRHLANELEDAERAAERAPRLKHRLMQIDDELRAAASTWMDVIDIETPCNASWDEMRGTDAVRWCGRCRRDVYDLACMTRDEIAALFARAEEMPCVRLRKRRDGRVVTADCPETSRTNPIARVITAGALCGAAAGIAASAAMTSMPRLGGARQVQHVEPLVSSPRWPAEPASIRLSSLRSEPEDEESEMDVTMGTPVDLLEATNAQPLWITEADLDRHVRWIAPEVWEIDRALVDRVSAELDLVTHEYRALPRERAGHIVGLAIYGIRRTSLLGRLGLQNGDVLVDINGARLSSPEALLNVESLARSTNSLFLRLERRGEERVHVYLLRQ